MMRGPSLCEYWKGLSKSEQDATYRTLVVAALKLVRGRYNWRSDQKNLSKGLVSAALIREANKDVGRHDPKRVLFELMLVAIHSLAQKSARKARRRHNPPLYGKRNAYFPERGDQVKEAAHLELRDHDGLPDDLSAETPERLLLLQERARQADAAIAASSPAEQAMISVLVSGDELSDLKDAAARLDKSPAAARQLMKRALETCRRARLTSTSQKLRATKKPESMMGYLFVAADQNAPASNSITPKPKS